MDGSTTDAEQRILDDYEANIWGAFSELDEDKWDETLWQQAVAAFNSRHDPAEVDTCLAKFWRQPTWEARRAACKAGLPAWARKGWVSPLVGQPVDLGLLDEVQWVNGRAQGWRDARAIVVEFWATWCGPCVDAFPKLSALALEYPEPEVKVIGMNVEQVFSDKPRAIDIEDWVAQRDDMQYNIAVDVGHKARDNIFKRGEVPGIPTAFLITPADGLVHFVGSPKAVHESLKALLAR